ncbi:exostosin-like 3 [Mercenaria mercenaria]|uniref:exostosin-like 3 n=1 Tax=Mercenaria mercenaria TaxID=6596 RepID=UPI00234E8BE4|nr:exostosin-like 3 [Mercenaria mercenaria]
MMDGYAPSRKRHICVILTRSRMAQLILCLLLVLIVTPLVAHYYISNMSGEGFQSHLSRLPSAHNDDDNLNDFQCNDLKSQVTELRRIRASVNNELRDLESRRQGLQVEITKHKTQLESLRMQQENMAKEIQQSKLNLDQLKLEEHEFANRFQPLLKAPEQILLDDGNKNAAKQPPSSPQSCKMHSCFDYSRCSLFSGFPVYVYGFENHFKDENLNEFVKSAVYHSFDKNPYVVNMPANACIFVVVLGETFSELSADSLQNKLQSLSHWNGDGRNHVLLNLARTSANFDLFHSVNTGRAIIVQSSFVESIYRCNFDIILPPSLGNSDGPVWSELPPLNPVRRQFVLSFVGQFSFMSNSDTTDWSNKAKTDLNNDQNFKSKTLKAELETQNANNPKNLANKLLDVESIIVGNLKKIESESKDNVYLNFMCDRGEKTGIIGEWALCGTEAQRADYLQKSTFNVIISPANFSLSSTTVFQTRLYESLKYGTIPVILGDYTHLPYEELLDWTKVAIILPKSRISEMYFLLSTLTDADVMDLKWNGRMFWETYFGTTASIISTMLAVLRTRLQIPAKPVKEEPSQSSVTNFIPVAQHIGVDAEDETDEVLGPVEPPFPSLTYKQNFTASTLRHVFNKPGDPFHLFPFTPFEKILPSDAKFRGSGYGFRPINRGEGGSGNEFSEAIGGNHPREQFTMVMLTYERSDVLIKAITRLKGLPYLNKVIVVWNNPAVPSENLGWPDIGVPVVVVKMSKNSLNNRFLPFEAIETEAVLSIDDDSHLRHDEIVFGFRVWREERDRIVGFPGRYHAWDVKHDAWLYNSNYTCEMSMVLTGAAFFHKYYAYLYSYTMPQAVRDKVDEYMNCEDIAMNFLVSHITRKPPVKVTSRWTFRCPGCPQQLALDESHFEERHKCINFLVEVYGYMPLLYTQYRVDSILFKTRISHDKQKCFKFI